MRYICKACGRKRESDKLKVVGQAHNTQNVWLCLDGNNHWTKCNKEKYKDVLKRFSRDLDVIDQERDAADKYQRDLEFLKSMQRRY